MSIVLKPFIFLTVLIEMESEDPEAKCLEVAERIIGCLNDGEILKRYLSIKQRIYQTQTQSPQLSPHLKRVALENRELTNELEQCRASLSTTQTLSDFVISQMEQLQKRILPNAGDRIDSSSFEKACESLLEVVEAKSASNNFVRQRLTDENAQLRDKLSTMTAAANDELKLLRQKMLDSDHKFRTKQRETMNELDTINKEIESDVQQISEYEEEMATTENTMNEKQTIAKGLMSKLNGAERKSSVAEKRRNDLKRQADRMRRELETIEREIGTQRAAQRFGVCDADECELAQLREIEEEVAQLIKDNERLELDLKKKKLITTNLDVTELSSISRI